MISEKAINFLRDSLMHNRDLKNGLDSKASILLALSGVIFSLSVGQLARREFLVLAIASFICAFLCILIVCLTFRTHRTEEKFSLICWFGFAKCNYKQYQTKLQKVFENDDTVADEYMKEIWSLANLSLKPKSTLLKIASFVLLLGLLCSFGLFFL